MRTLKGRHPGAGTGGIENGGAGRAAADQVQVSAGGGEGEGFAAGFRNRISPAVRKALYLTKEVGTNAISDSRAVDCQR